MKGYRQNDIITPGKGREEMPKSERQKQKILYIKKFLLENTDEEHPATTEDIIKELARHDIQAERKSVYADIEVLKDFGMDILHVRGRNGGYFVGSREFEVPELKLLVDAVQSSKFLTLKKSNQLIRKLEGLASKAQARQLARQVVVSNRIKTMEESIYYNVDRIHEALTENRIIEFQYKEWTVTKELRLKKDGARYRISPWALTWDSENYYMIGFDEAADKIKHYRVDKMDKIRKLPDLRQGKAHFDCLDMGKYANKTFGMFGGKDEDVHLTCENYLAGVIIDRFGSEVPMRKADDTHFNVRIKVALSPQFYGWLSGIGSGVRITGPEHVRAEYKEYLEKILKNYE